MLDADPIDSPRTLETILAEVRAGYQLVGERLVQDHIAGPEQECLRLLRGAMERFVVGGRVDCERGAEWVAQQASSKSGAGELDAALVEADPSGPGVVRVLPERGLLESGEGDGVVRRCRKAARRIRVRFGWRRKIRTGLLGDFHLKTSLIDRAMPVLETSYAMRSAALGVIDRAWEAACAGRSASEVTGMLSTGSAYLADTGEQARESLSDAMARSLAEFDRDAARDGTSDLPWRWTLRFRTRLRTASLKRRSRRRRADWSRLEEGQSGSLAMSAALYLVVMRAGTVLAERLAADQECREDLLEMLERASNAVEVCKGSATAALEDSPDPHKTSAGLETAEAELSNLLATEVLVPLSEASASGEPDETETTERLVEAILEGVCEEHRVATEPPTWQPGEPPPSVRLATVRFRQTAEATLLRSLRPVISDSESQLTEARKIVSEAVDSTRRVVRFNFESAIVELEPSDSADPPPDASSIGTAREFAIGGLQRAETRLSERRAEIEAVARTAAQGVAEAEERCGADLARDLQEGRAIEMRYRALRAIAAAHVQGYGEFRKTLRVQVLARIRTVSARVVQGSSRAARKVTTLLRLTPPQQETIQETMDEAERYHSALDHLPPIYRRLFRLAPLQSDEFLMGRGEEFDILRKALARWQSGQPGTVAVVGEVGSGKTSLVNCSERVLLSDQRVVRYRFAHTISTEPELQTALAEAFGLPGMTLDDLESALQEGPVITALFESGQQLFLRRIGGFQAFRRFLLFVSRTQAQVLWVVTFSEYAWIYLDRVLGISDHFAFRVETRNMSAEDLEAAIVARHSVSGYKLVFSAEGASSKRLQRALRNAKNDAAKQETLREEYFERLSRVSRGNIQIALYLWSRSLGPLDETTLGVAPVQSLSFAFLDKLSLQKLFALTAILQHGSLTPREHAEVMHCTVGASLLLFEALDAHSLVRPIDLDAPVGLSGDTVYVLTELMRRPVVDLLRSRNILH